MTGTALVELDGARSNEHYGARFNEHYGARSIEHYGARSNELNRVRRHDDRGDNAAVAVRMYGTRPATVIKKTTTSMQTTTQPALRGPLESHDYASRECRHRNSQNDNDYETRIVLSNGIASLMYVNVTETITTTSCPLPPKELDVDLPLSSSQRL